MINILAFSGSTRTGSYNKRILDIAVQGARDTGANVTIINLLDFSLPLYDGDLEENNGLPNNCLTLKSIFLNHQGLLLALPEYNSSLSGVFKNTIDWVSRPTPQESEPLSCFNNKTAALMSASPSRLGGMRGLVHARSMLENINVMVIPSQVSIGNADTAFDDVGGLRDQKSSQSLKELGRELAYLTRKINDVSMPMLDSSVIGPTPLMPSSKQKKGNFHDFDNEGGLLL